jgi:Tol biopolymer transport system component
MGPRAIRAILPVRRGVLPPIVAIIWMVGSPVAAAAGVAGPCTATGYQSSKASFPNNVGDASTPPPGFSPTPLTGARDWRVSTSKNVYVMGRSSILTRHIQGDVELFGVRWPVLSGQGSSRQAVSRAWDMHTISRLARVLGLHAQTASCDAEVRLVADEIPIANAAGAGGIAAALIGGIGLARVAFRRRKRVQQGGKGRAIYPTSRLLVSVLVGGLFGLTAGLGEGLYMQQAGNISPFDQRTLWFPVAGVVLGILAGLLGGWESGQAIPAPTDLGAAPGRQVGKYALQARVGAGYSGTVYLAWDEVLERRVAVKELEPAFLKEPRLLQRFREEAQTMARLDHPNCVQVYDFFESAEGAYLVSEYIDGASLREVITHSGRLTPEQALGVLKGGLSGLSHAHSRGLVHRDIKPENILCDLQGTSKLADFGLAIFTSEKTDLEGPSAGTPLYMSPEQTRGEALDHRSDIYSSGAVLFELLTGQPPYAGGNSLAIMRMHAEEPVPDPQKANPRLPNAVAAMLTKAMAKNPADRHQTADDFISALTAAAAEGYGSNWEEKASVAALIGGVVAAGGSAASSAASSAGAGQVSITGAGAVAAAAVGSAAVAAATAGRASAEGVASPGGAGALTQAGGGGLLGLVSMPAQVVAGVTAATLVLGVGTIIHLPPPPPPPTTSPPSSAVIVFERFQTQSRDDIFSVHPDGTGLRQLTHDESSSEPDVSRDGARVVFVGFGATGPHIMTMGVDGSGRHDLGIDGIAPRFSPDGARIVFYAANTTGPLSIVNVDGSGARTLPGTENGADPAWTPNGAHIIFARVSAPITGSDGMWEVDPAGGSPRQLFGGILLKPDVSPSGAQVAFDRIVNQQETVSVSGLDGYGERIVVSGASGGRWSPDGQHLVTAIVGAGPGLRITDADGANQRSIVADMAALNPSWGGAAATTPAPATPPPAGATRVQTFEPWVLNAASGEAAPRPGLVATTTDGTCDSGSSDDPGRAEAFRCMFASAVGGVNGADPCFIPNAPLILPGPAVLCSSDPTSNQAVLINLTQSLPSNYANPEDSNAPPWVLVLGGGLKCFLLGHGTNTNVLSYSCTGGILVTAPDRSKAVWTVQEGAFHGTQAPVLSSIHHVVNVAYR